LQSIERGGEVSTSDEVEEEEERVEGRSGTAGGVVRGKSIAHNVHARSPAV
jgi:hypothetical protein